MNYTVIFTQYHTYEVEANSESEAKNKAYQEFRSDMCRSVGKTWYDEVEVECDKDEGTIECDGRCFDCDYCGTDDCPDNR